jgi:methionine synthase II (cobalamin-independent)
MTHMLRASRRAARARRMTATRTPSGPDRIEKYALVAGRENVIAGTDCDLGGRVGHAKLAWAKFEAMAEGARLGSKELWAR